MKKDKVKKYVRRGIGVTLLLGFGAIVYTLLTAKSTPCCGGSENIDDVSMYDDMEFYEMTHNEDGSLNDTGKELL